MNKQKPIQLSFSMGFQIKYCLIIAAIFIGASVLLFLLMNKALSGNYLESLRTLYFLDQNLSLYLSIIAFLQVCLILVLTLVITLLVSHRIAGPVFRYEAVLSKIVSGEYPLSVATRDTDQLKPMVDSLNQLTIRCRETFEGLQDLSKAVAAEINPQESVDKKSLESFRQKISAVRANMDKLASEGSPE